MDRSPIAAGRFYPDNPQDLLKEIDYYLQDDSSRPENSGTIPESILCMVPHAGYVCSGAVTGKTLAACKPATTVFLLGPNHTGRGEDMAVWPEGRWHYPGGSLSVDSRSATRLYSESKLFCPDFTAHSEEHSLEVIIPFLGHLNPETKIIPIAFKDYSLPNLLQAGREVADLISHSEEQTTIIVSSDMNHYKNHDQTKIIDKLAIDQILALSPEGLFNTVARNKISMCGVLAMTAGIQAAISLGGSRAELVDYATSAQTCGGFDQAVGYAGITIS